MKIGLFIFPTDLTIRPAVLASAAEELGFDALFFPEHGHIPTSRRSTPRGGVLREEFLRMMDQFVCLAAAATATERLLVGSAVCLAAQRDPIHVAKAVASLDQLSDGRAIFGVGAGWNREEHENHSPHPFEARFGVLGEHVEAIKEIWRNEVAEFEGEFVAFPPLWCGPRPVQEPHPPVWFGGSGRGVLQRVVRHGEGWIPVLSDVVDDIPGRITELGQLSEAAGRPRPTVSLLGERPDDEALLGTDPSLDFLEDMAALGIDRCVLRLPSSDEPEVLEVLRSQAKKVTAYLG